jgi:trk system potassium uptake protein TrkA
VKNILGIHLDPYEEVKNVFIAGATDMGLTLAQKLLDSGIAVVIMELSEERTQIAAETLQFASIIHSDPLGRGVLKKEEIGRFNVLMAMGHSMERNILISVLAKQFGVPTALALVDRIDLKRSVEKTLVDDVVVPNLLLVKTISNLIKGSGPLRRKTLKSEEIAVQEIKLNRKMRCIGKKVSEFDFAKELFGMVCIVKGGGAFVPEDTYVLSEGDRVFLLYHPSDYKTVNRWLVG